MYTEHKTYGVISVLLVVEFKFINNFKNYVSFHILHNTL